MSSITSTRSVESFHMPRYRLPATAHLQCRRSMPREVLGPVQLFVDDLALRASSIAECFSTPDFTHAVSIVLWALYAHALTERHCLDFEVLVLVCIYVCRPDTMGRRTARIPHATIIADQRFLNQIQGRVASKVSDGISSPLATEAVLSLDRYQCPYICCHAVQRPGVDTAIGPVFLNLPRQTLRRPLLSRSPTLET